MEFNSKYTQFFAFLQVVAPVGSRRLWGGKKMPSLFLTRLKFSGPRYNRFVDEWALSEGASPGH
jgi:hypothetical protein